MGLAGLPPQRPSFGVGRAYARTRRCGLEGIEIDNWLKVSAVGVDTRERERVLDGKGLAWPMWCSNCRT